MNLGGKKVDPAASLKNARPMHLGPIVMLQPEGSKIVHLSSEMGAGVVMCFDHLEGETQALRVERIQRWACKRGSRAFRAADWRRANVPDIDAQCYLGADGKRPSALGLIEAKDQTLAADICCNYNEPDGDIEGKIALNRLAQIFRKPIPGKPTWGLGTHTFYYGREHFLSSTSLRIELGLDYPTLKIDVDLYQKRASESVQNAIETDLLEINSPGGPAEVKLISAETWLSKMWKGASHVLHVVVPKSLGGGDVHLWRAEYEAQDLNGNLLSLVGEMQFSKDQTAREPQIWPHLLQSCGWGK